MKLIGLLVMVILLSSVSLVYGEPFDKKKCIESIPKDAGFAVANKMRKDCEKRESGESIKEHLKKEADIRKSPYEKYKFEKSLGSQDYGKDHTQIKKEMYSKARKDMKPSEYQSIISELEKKIERLEKLVEKLSKS